MRLFGASGERGREKEGRVEGVGEGVVDGCSDTRLAVKVLCLQGGSAARCGARLYSITGRGCILLQSVVVVIVVVAAVLCVGL